jgi:hypothetical protein
MCDPITAVVATVASTTIGAYGQYQAGQAAKQAGDYNAAIARNNQIIAERAAVDAEKRGEIAADEQRRKTARIAGAQRAAFGSSGLALDSAYSMDILGDTAAFGELDALTIKSNAQREAYGYRVQGMNYAAEEVMSRVRGKNANTAGMISAASTLIGGGATAGDRWIQYNKPVR